MTYRYKRRTNFERDRDMERVKALLEKGYSGRQISKETGIAYSTTCKYIQKITKTQKENIEESNESLHERALIIKKRYQEYAEVCREIMHDSKASKKDRLDAGRMLLGSENNIYRLLFEGPLKMNTTIETSKRQLQSKAIHADLDMEKVSSPKKRRHTTTKRREHIENNDGY